ncbi:MAG TPA: class I adenylate-forming enzyme family protein [Burkholderiaceae bacterium]|jgi:acyl-CoA synthetase (AMP-forming)/AMP-acid ligase II|nr:class I adenylate-forming enzyme family protein [Burkholderiaceae bacterium]
MSATAASADTAPDAPAFRAIADLVAEHARDAPRAKAIVDASGTLDYAALDALADRVAAALQREGIAPGEAVAVCAANSARYAAVFLGALRAGAALAPLSPSSTPASFDAMLRDSGARLLFVDAHGAALLGARAASPALAALQDGAPGRNFEDWLAPTGSTPRRVAITPEMAFNIIYSSGTTGTPKGIVQPHAMRWAHVMRGASLGYGPEAVTMIATPLYSNTTLVSFLPTLAFGGCVVLMDRFDALRYLETAQRHRATHAMLVPVQYQRLLAHPRFGEFDLSAFRMKFCTSAPFAAALKADILARWPGGLVEYYGMTEGGGSCALLAHEHPDKLHTVGQPLPGHDIRLIDEQGRELPAGATGEIVGRSGAMMTGYHRQPERTAEAEWFDAEGRRYIRTGDVGRFDSEGFLTLLDRRKDMIISGGFNIYPSDLEAVLRGHPAVAEAAVVGVPSDQWGETPVAWIVAHEGAALDAESLRGWANARLGRTQRIAALHFIDALPRSAIGKVLKTELRARHRP